MEIRCDGGDTRDTLTLEPKKAVCLAMGCLIGNGFGLESCECSSA